MRGLFLFLLLAGITGGVFAQRISGRIVNSLGEPVEYVNLGVKNTQVGQTSDGKGHFSIYIPDTLRNESLMFSHLSYEVQFIPVTELLRKMSGEGEVIVTLPGRAFQMQPVMVSPGRIRYRRYEKTFRSGMGYYSSPSIDTAKMKENEVQRVNAEIGTVYSVKERLWLKTITLDVSRCSLDSVLLRVNLFRYEDRRPIEELLYKPIYIVVRQDFKQASYEIDVEPDNIVLELGDVAVGLDIIELYGDKWNALLLPHYSGGGYRRGLLSDEVEKQSRNPGISLYGRILPD